MRSSVLGRVVRVALLLTLLLALPLLATPPAHADLAGIWAVDDGEKIFRDDLTHPLEAGGAGNSVWDGTTVSLFAGRNEIVAFQLILEADGAGASSVNVTVSDLTNGAATIPGSHPLPTPNSYLGLGVELFTEHYLNVTQYSYNDPAWGGFYTTAAANPQITGWIPDALIPFSAAAGLGGAPFDIGASLNQGVWVDVYVDKSLPAGTYTGTLEVTVGASTEASIPIELEVLSITLPDETHYRSMVFYSDYSIQPRHDLAWGADLWEMVRHYHRMAHRHRLELIGDGRWDEITELGGALTGDLFTPAQGYQGPGEGVGNSLFSVHTYGGSFGSTESEYRTNSDAWVNWFDANAPDIDYFLYLIDEPGSDMFDWIHERAGWIHNNPGPGSRLPVFVTKWPMSGLIGAVDIWSMQAPSYYPLDIAAARARGEKAWLYAGNRPQAPMDVIDEYGVAMRLKPWVAYKCDIERWFTWESTHWEPNSNEVPNDVPKNVFVDPVTFYAGYDGSRGNGDGTLFYPGEDYVFPAQNREYAGPMSSIRMKMYRRGIQDYEYMWLAEQAGEHADVQRIIQSLLPDVMWDAPVLPTWSNSNADYEQARRYFADLLGPPRAPEARFEGSPVDGHVSLTIEFTDLSIFSPTSWSWDFGDTGASTEQDPAHTYTSEGTYTVSLTATNAQGLDTETKTDYITVGPPVYDVYAYPDTWGTYDGWSGVTVSSGSLADLEEDDEVYMVVASNVDNQRYSMWYTTDTPYVPADVAAIQIEYQAKGSQVGTPSSLIFVRKADGNFDHMLNKEWATDDEWYIWQTTDIASYMDGSGLVGFEVCGCPMTGDAYTISSDVLRFRLTLYGSDAYPPAAMFLGAPTSGSAPLTVDFTDLSTNNPTSWSWDFGDSGTSTKRNPSYEYSSAGSYTVSLTAFNTTGQDTETMPDFITVSSQLSPVADFSASPTGGTAPLTVDFTDRSTGSPTSWSWDFGDGETSTAQHPSHIYDEVGSYTVSLTATNTAASAVETKTDYISVGFGDVLGSHWAFDYIVACCEAGIVKGYPDGFYRPDAIVTRDQMAVFVSRAISAPTGPGSLAEFIPPTTPTFPDVTSGGWAYDYVEYAAENNIVVGYTDGNYYPTLRVARGQMAVFLARALADPMGEAGLASYQPPLTPTFSDVPTNYWAYNYIEYIAEHDVTSGYPGGYYRPAWQLARDQMAVFIARAFNLVP